jgi:hypothetical protein
MADKGKGFENLFKSWLKRENIYHQRFYDSRSVGGMSAPRPADFFAYRYPQLYFFELKDSETDKIYYSRFTQIPALALASKNNIISMFVLRYNSKYIYLVNALKLQSFIKANYNQKYFSLENAEKIGIKLLNSADLHDLI